MDLANTRMINNELLNKDIYVVPEQSPIIILDRKSSMCMAKNGKDTKYTRYISRIIQFLRNDKECNINNKVCCEGGLQLT